MVSTPVNAEGTDWCLFVYSSMVMPLEPGSCDTKLEPMSLEGVYTPASGFVCSRCSTIARDPVTVKL